MTKLLAEFAVCKALVTFDPVVPRAEPTASLTPGMPVADAKAPKGLLFATASLAFNADEIGANSGIAKDAKLRIGAIGASELNIPPKILPLEPPV